MRFERFLIISLFAALSRKNFVSSMRCIDESSRRTSSHFYDILERVSSWSYQLDRDWEREEWVQHLISYFIGIPRHCQHTRRLVRRRWLCATQQTTSPTRLDLASFALFSASAVQKKSFHTNKSRVAIPSRWIDELAYFFSSSWLFIDFLLLRFEWTRANRTILTLNIGQ